MIFCAITLIAINVKSWMISGSINYLHKPHKVIIASNFKSHFFMPTNNSFTKISNIFRCSITLNNFFYTVSKNNINFCCITKNTTNVCFEKFWI